MSDGDYITLGKEGEGRLTDRRSEFIAYASPVYTEEDAIAFVGSVRARHRDARHCVFAYSVRRGAQKRYSDDGEPQGSAGRPVLDVIEKNGLDGAVIAVVRYFGGILLGTGGLVRAYSGAASAAVSDAGVVSLSRSSRVRVRAGYNDSARVQRRVTDSGAVIESGEYGADVTLTFTVPSDKADSLCYALTDLCAGRAEITVLGEGYFLNGKELQV